MQETASSSSLPFRQRAPFAALFIAASLGVLASDQHPEWWPAWSAAFLCAAPVVWKISSTPSASLLTFFMFAFWHGNQVTTDVGYQRSHEKPFDANEHTVTLLVLSEPKLDQLRSIQRFVALVSCIDNRAVCFHVSAECCGEPFGYGDRIIAQGKFFVPTHPLNPGEFDFGAYLQRQNIYLSFRTHRDVPAIVATHNQGNPLVAIALAGRHRILQALQEGLQDDTEVTQVIQGIILGGRAETNPALKRLFRDTGTIHLFAASGLQVGLFTGLAWSCLRYIRLPRQTVALAIVPVAISYCALTGFYPATLRATVMAMFMAVGVSLERPVAAVNSLCGSGLLILIHDTQELFQTGFQLSFVAVFAILTAVRPFGHMLYRPFQIDPFFPMRLLSPWQRNWHKAMFQTCELFSLSSVCWAATAPILIFQDHHLSLISIFANLLVVPLATTVMLLGVTALLAGIVSRSIAVCLNNTSWLITKLILLVLHTATLVPCHSINVAPSSLLQPDRVTALSEGSDHVLHLHIKGHDWLINTGKLSHWRSITEPYLQSQGVNRLEELILCDTPAHEIQLLEQVNGGFQVAQIVPSPQGQVADQILRFRVERCNPSVDSDGRAALVEIFLSERPVRSEPIARDPAVEAILVRLDQFRVLILPKVTEMSLSALKCGHADVVYCGRQMGRRFPRDLMIAKLSPSILVLNGTKPEVIANSVTSPSSPKCFYLNQDGAVTAALLNGELVIRGYCGSEVRLPSLSR
ncbi:MAG: ComEC family competence protein [Verrucomicrobia bacterium]|nr:ComEC family competence protein [Verrucomicrobiota bacterium]